MDEQINEAMTKEELVDKINELEQEIETLKTDLEDVNAQLESLPADEPDDTDAEVEEEQEVLDLRKRQAELTSDIVSKQMQVVALKKKLQDINASDSMDELSNREDQLWQ